MTEDEEIDAFYTLPILKLEDYSDSLEKLMVYREWLVDWFNKTPISMIDDRENWQHLTFVDELIANFKK